MNTWSNHFWKSLDFLRGISNISDSTDIILSLCYLKFVNDNKNEIEIPEDAQWEIFVERAKKGHFDSGLNEAIHFLVINNYTIEDTFSVMNIDASRNISSIPQIYEMLIDVISKADFSKGSGMCFSELFDDLLLYFTNSEQRRNFGEIQSKELTELMQSFFPKDKSFSIFNPFAGYASLGVNLPQNSSYYGEELMYRTAAIAKLRLHIHNYFNTSTDITISNKDSISWANLSKDTFDIVAFHPPFNVKLNDSTFQDLNYHGNKYLLRGNANPYIISEMLKKLKPNGKMIFLMPNSFLFSQNSIEIKLKKVILREYRLETIISLPRNILGGYTGIPVNLIVISRKDSLGTVDLINAEDCVTKVNAKQNSIKVKDILKLIDDKSEKNKRRTVTYKEIEDNDFSLLPQRYLIEANNNIDLTDAILLSDLLQFKTPNRVLGNVFGKRVGIKELQNSADVFSLDLDQLNNEELSKGMAVLEKGSLLIASKGTSIKPTFFDFNEDGIFYTPNNIFALKVDTKKVSVDYLIAELHKDYVTKQLQMYTVGAGIPSISKKQLLSVKIFLPSSIDQQLQILEKEKSERFQVKLKELGFEKEIARLKKEHNEDLRSKKHNIMQHLNNVKSSASVLLSFMENNKGSLHYDDIISYKRNITVKKRFDRLLESLDASIYYIDDLTNDVTFGEKKTVDIEHLINSCIEKGIQANNFEVLLEKDEASFIESDEIIIPKVLISPDDFEKVYNNLLENAVTHGFNDIDKKYTFLIKLSYILEDKQIIVRFLNNGKSLPKGMIERYGIKGETGGETGNTGYGAWQIKQIVNNWNADFTVIDEPGDTYKVAFELKMNIEQE